MIDPVFARINPTDDGGETLKNIQEFISNPESRDNFNLNLCTGNLERKEKKEEVKKCSIYKDYILSKKLKKDDNSNEYVTYPWSMKWNLQTGVIETVVSGKTKEDILKENGFLYHYIQMAYVNYERKKIFSLEAIKGQGSVWIVEKINDKNDGWAFYFIIELNDEQKYRILDRINAKDFLDLEEKEKATKEVKSEDKKEPLTYKDLVEGIQNSLGKIEWKKYPFNSQLKEERLESDDEDNIEDDEDDCCSEGCWMCGVIKNAVKHLNLSDKDETENRILQALRFPPGFGPFGRKDESKSKEEIEAEDKKSDDPDTFDLKVRHCSEELKIAKLSTEEYLIRCTILESVGLDSESNIKPGDVIFLDYDTYLKMLRFSKVEGTNVTSLLKGFDKSKTRIFYKRTTMSY